MIQKYYTHYKNWEDWQNGMYRDVKDKQYYIQKSIQCLRDPKESMLRVIKEWKQSSRENLSDNFFDGKFCVENVIPYYEPLITAKKRGRHLYWTNFNLPSDLGDRRAENFIHAKQSELEKFHNIDLSTYKGTQRKDKIARNLVDYEAGLTIFNTARGIIKSKIKNQAELF